MLYKLKTEPELPRCICFGRYRQNVGWNHRGKKTDRNLLLIFINGDARFTIDGKIMTVKHGDQLLIPAGSRYTARTDEGCEYYFLHFTDELEMVSERPSERLEISKTINIEDQKKPDCFLPAVQDINGDYAQIIRLLVEMNKLKATNRPEEQYLFQLDFSRLLLMLSIMTRDDEREQSELSERVRLYIGENITKPLTLTGLSEHFGVSKSYLLRLYKRDCGMSVTAYINAAKLDLAAELLNSSMMNVSETSDYLGFSDSGYFSRIFRKRFGVSPSMLR